MPLQFQIRECQISNDHETRILIGEDDYLELCDPSILGIDPPEFFSQPALCSDGQLLVGRCSCGCVGCSDEFVTTSFKQHTVTWTGRRSSPAGMTFALSEYHAEIQRAIEDTSWETIQRRAERLVGKMDFSSLTKHNVTFEWASARIRPNQMHLSLKLRDTGLYQLLCSVPWSQHDPADAVEAVRGLLEKEIIVWPDVVYFPQSTQSGKPSIAGPGWRRCQ